MNKVKERELLPDILRGFAIFLVVFGHCIQEGSGNTFKANTMYFSDKVYQFIYSFHMPLFMMISGYFAWDSMEKAQSAKARWRMLGKKALKLLMPVLGWTCFDYMRIAIEQGISHVVFLSITEFLKSFLISMLTNAWFLWAVFWCFVIVFFMHYYFKDSFVIYILGFLILFFIPDGLGLGAYKYMMPYFIVAFYFRKWQKNGAEKLIYMRKRMSEWRWIGALGVTFGFLFLFYDENSFIYLSGYKLIGKNVWNQLGIDFYRMLIGFVGAGFFILILKKIRTLISGRVFLFFEQLGRNSLGIYLISGYIILEIGYEFSSYFEPNYLLNFLQAVIVTIMSFILTIVMKRIPLLKWLVG